MEGALRAVLDDLQVPASANELSPAVLLITDGAVWAIDEIIQVALGSSQRIFVIGVGSASSEHLLTQLAEQTGGAFEAVSPNEDMEAAIVRMFHRLRGAKAMQARVEWGAPPVWQSPIPKTIYPGETVHVFATFGQAPVTTPRLLWTAGSPREACTTEPFGREDAASLVRLCGARQLALCADRLAATALALRYQLISPYTNLFLVYERAADEKAGAAPTLQQIHQMHAAGHLGMGTVVLRASSVACSMDVDPRCDASLLASFEHMSEASAPYEHSVSCAPPFSPESESANADALATLRLLDALAPAARDLAEIVAHIKRQYDSSQLVDAVNFLVRLGSREATAWALCLEWLVALHREEITLGRHATRLLRAALSKVTDDEREAAGVAMETMFPDPRRILYAAPDAP
jgi:Ca-activated chloride channel family protein